jgi:multicomponent Na+:H+ antiporter subunit E
MNYFFLNSVLAFIWALLIGDLSLVNLGAGFVIGYLILSVTRFADRPSAYFYKLGAALKFLGFFLWELLISNLKLAFDVLTPPFLMTPRIIALPLDVKTDMQITALANLISLTPGTLSLDVSTDRKTLYIHAMYAEDVEKTKQKIKNGMERRVLELLSSDKE